MKFISYKLFVSISVFLYVFFPVILAMEQSSEEEKVSTVTEGNVIPQGETSADKPVGKVEEDVKETKHTGTKSTTESQEEPELSEPIDKTEEPVGAGSSSEHHEIVPYHDSDRQSSDSSLANNWPLASSSFTEKVEQILSSYPSIVPYSPPVHEVIDLTADNGETRLKIGDHGHSFSVEHYRHHPKDDASHLKRTEYTSFAVSNGPVVVTPAQIKQFVPKDMFPKVEETLLQLANEEPKEEPKEEVKELEDVKKVDDDTSEPRFVELPDDEPIPEKASGELKPKEIKTAS